MDKTLKEFKKYMKMDLFILEINLMTLDMVKEDFFTVMEGTMMESNKIFLTIHKYFQRKINFLIEGGI